jgi:hypothetical protein
MKQRKTLVIIFAAIFMLLFSASSASAKVMWGKTELKKGQIGKVTIVTNVNAAKLNGKTLTQDKRLKKGEEFRVYTYRVIGNSGYYGLGGGLFVKKSDRIKYETPSKRKLAQLEKETIESSKEWKRKVETIGGKIEDILHSGFRLTHSNGYYNYVLNDYSTVQDDLKPLATEEFINGTLKSYYYDGMCTECDSILFPWSVDTDEKFELLQWSSDKLVFQTIEEHFEEYYLVSYTFKKVNGQWLLDDFDWDGYYYY